MGLTSQEKQLLRNINSKLCDLNISQGGQNSNNTASSDNVESLLEEIRDSLLQQPQINTVIPIYLCDSDGIAQGYQIIEKDEVTNALSFTYYDLENNLLAQKPQGTSPCDLQDKDCGTGWMQYSDTQYTEVSPFISPVQTDFVLPNNGSFILDSQKPIGVTDLFDIANQHIIGIDNKAGDGQGGNGLNITILFDAISTQNATEIDFSIDIGGTIGKIFPRTLSFSKSAGEVDNFSLSFSGYNLDTWVQNGGKVTLNAEHEISIFNIIFIIGIYHRA